MPLQVSTDNKTVVVDSESNTTHTVYESIPAFRDALRELERLKTTQLQDAEMSDLIRLELKHLEEEVAMRKQYIDALIDRL